MLLIFQIDYPETTNLHHIPSLQVSNISQQQQQYHHQLQQHQITTSTGPNHITTIAANSVSPTAVAATPNGGGSVNSFGIIQTQQATTVTAATYRTGAGSLGSIGYNCLGSGGINTTTNIGINSGVGIYRTANIVDSSTMDHHHQIRHLPGGVNIGVFDENNVSFINLFINYLLEYFTFWLSCNYQRLSYGHQHLAFNYQRL